MRSYWCLRVQSMMMMIYRTHEWHEGQLVRNLTGVLLSYFPSTGGFHITSQVPEKCNVHSLDKNWSESGSGSPATQALAHFQMNTSCGLRHRSNYFRKLRYVTLETYVLQIYVISVVGSATGDPGPSVEVITHPYLKTLRYLNLKSFKREVWTLAFFVYCVVVVCFAVVALW